MSISRAWYVTCDNCGNPSPIVTDGGAREARAVASGERYTRARVDGRMADLCPRCLGADTLDGVQRREWHDELRLDPATLRAPRA